MSTECDCEQAGCGDYCDCDCHLWDDDFEEEDRHDRGIDADLDND